MVIRVDMRLRRTYIFGRRLHHGLVGAAGIAVSAALVLHDRRDFPWRFIPD
jgi:hypothetical protein